VVFYGGLSPRRANIPSPIARAGDASCPVLGLFGGDDPHIPAADIAAFDNALAGSLSAHEVIVYPGAPHSFFDRSFEQHTDACEDAWRRVLVFVARVGSAR
jgi:carboxymethylenebutenolidase